jgi:uncharacterized protein (TIGR02117 family)
MRKAARRTFKGLLVALALFVGLAVLTARSGDRRLYPPADGAPAVEIHVVNHGYHSGLSLPRAALARVAARRGHAALLTVSTRFADYDWLEIGWGDEGFYRLVPSVASLTVRIALRALFMPGNASILHVVGLRSHPQAAFAALDVVPIRISEAGLERLVGLLEASFARGGNAAPADDLGPGIYGPSRFFRGSGAFHLLRVCNHWVADLLDAAGIPTSSMLATLPAGLLLDLRWRSGLLPLPRPGA